MANIVYPLLLFLFIFGAASSFINSAGLYQHNLNPSALSTNSTGSASTFNSAVQSASSNQESFSFQTIFLMGQCIAGGVTAILTLGPLLISYGVPPSMAAYAISPLGIILMFWMIEWFFGRYIE
jgi:hypothetical protein